MTEIVSPDIPARSTKVFLNTKNSGMDEQTTRAAIGFYIIWIFENDLANFASPKINIPLVHKLKSQEITIEEFVQKSMRDEITSQVLKEAGDRFSKYYFDWKYLSDCTSVLGEKYTGTWQNYAQIKPIISQRFAYWKSDPQKALDQKIKEIHGKEKRAGQLNSRDRVLFEIPHHPNTQFDDEEFLQLLQGSISLTMEEKERVIAAIPRLSITQINELFTIFREEKEKFSELENEFADDVKKLKKQREKELDVHENNQEETEELDNEQAEAERIKREMGL